VTQSTSMVIRAESRVVQYRYENRLSNTSARGVNLGSFTYSALASLQEAPPM
jgi:hypothetical protein